MTQKKTRKKPISKASMKAGRKQDPTAKPKRRWKRITLWVAVGLVVAMLATAGGFYLWFRAQVGASNERVDPEIIEALAEPTSTTRVASGTDITAAPDAPSGMNIVLIGSDTRSSTGKGGRSDTIILVHVDPDQEYLSMLSIPRDLRVVVPGHGNQKINAAYAYGGAALLIRTVQSSLGVDLDHYVRVDFNAFKDITDTLGGVYIDVDRKYSDGKIRLEPGYQLLDGLNALRFCRTRHDSNYDFGRMERQQRYLSAVRDQAMGWNLILKLPSLIEATFANVDTDLSANEIIELAYWAVKLEGGRTKRITLVARTGTIAGGSYVLASEKQIAAVVTDFLTPPTEIETIAEPGDWPPEYLWAELDPVDLTGISVNVSNDTGRTGQGALAAVRLADLGASVDGLWTAEDPPSDTTEVLYPSGGAESARLVADALGIKTTRQTSTVDKVSVTLGPFYTIHPSQLQEATFESAPNRQAWKTLTGKVDFPLVAPAFIPAACKYSYQRAHSIQTGGDDHPAVRVGYRYSGRDQYLGIGQTTWLDAPLASPGVDVEGHGTTFTVVGTSTKVDRVWWIQDGVLHWVSNTLRYELTGEKLLAVAMSCVAVPTAQE